MANSLIGASFSDYVHKQVNLRQSKLKLNANRDNRWLSWQNGNTAFLRLSSGIDVNGDGGAMAKKYQLFNTQFDGNKLASGVGLGGNTLYGWESDPGEGYGYAIPPGLVSADIKAKNRGSLREANINILCHNKKQFEIISKLYLRLGYTMLLEWGWSYYYDNSGTFHENYHIIANQANNTFMFNSNQTPQGILNQINKDRETSNGNYDAIIGVVANYSWNLEKDGSYNITLTLTTWGDITESLKSNTSTGTDPNTPTTGSSNLEKSANKSNLHKILYAAADQCFKSNKSSIPILYSSDISKQTGLKATQYNTGQNNQDAVIQLDFPNLGETGQGSKHQYITLSDLLRMMQNYTLMYNTSATNKDALVNLDYKLNDSYCLTRKSSFSLDPRVCMIPFFKEIFGNNLSLPKGVNYPTSGQAGNISNITDHSIFRVGANGGSLFGTNTDYIGRIGYIWVNINHVAKVLDSYIIRETGAVSVYDFLQNLMKDIQSALGNINNFEVIYDEDLNTITIIDSTYIPGIELAFPSNYKNLTKFVTHTLDTKEGSFVRDAKVQTKLSNAFASQTTIGAQANGDVVGEDATMLSKFNNGLEDRLVKKKGSEEMEDKQKLIDSFRATRLNYKFELDYGSISDDFINSNKQTMIDCFRFLFNQDVLNNKISPTGFLPIDLELTMDGLSGIKIYENFTADDRMLPPEYQNNVKFITTGVSHKIQNNDWTTTISSVMSPIGDKSTSMGAAPGATGTNKSSGNQTIQSTATQPTVQSKTNIVSNKCGLYDYSKFSYRDDKGRFKNAESGKFGEDQKSNIRLIDEYLTKYGYETVESRIAMLGVVGKECRFRPKQENLNYSVKNLLDNFGSYFGKGKENPDDYAFKPEKIGNYVYGGVWEKGVYKLGRYGNTVYGDGFKYRGGGFVQITFKSGYEHSEKVLKSNENGKLYVDVVKDPNAINDVHRAALTSVARLGAPLIKNNEFSSAKNIKNGYIEFKKKLTPTVQEDVNVPYYQGKDIYGLAWTFARSNAGWKSGWFDDKKPIPRKRDESLSWVNKLIEFYETDPELQKRTNNWKYCSSATPLPAPEPEPAQTQVQTPAPTPSPFVITGSAVDTSLNTSGLLSPLNLPTAQDEAAAAAAEAERKRILDEAEAKAKADAEAKAKAEAEAEAARAQAEAEAKAKADAEAKAKADAEAAKLKAEADAKAKPQTQTKTEYTIFQPNVDSPDNPMIVQKIKDPESGIEYYYAGNNKTGWSRSQNENTAISKWMNKTYSRGLPSILLTL